MSEALEYFYYFFDCCVDFIFNDLEFFEGVTFGWICVCVFVFGVLLHNVLALPRMSPSTHAVPDYNRPNVTINHYQSHGSGGAMKQTDSRHLY